MLREWSDRNANPRPVLDKVIIGGAMLFGAAFVIAQVYFLLT